MTQVSKFAGSAAALIAGLACLTVPAQAAEAEGNSATQATTAMSASASAPRATEKKYCVVDEITGTRMPKKVCRTKAEWSAEGVDVSKTK